MATTFSPAFPAETCTVVTGATGDRCGAPATLAFETSRGTRYAECVDHAHVPAPLAALAGPAHPPTRTTKPYVLVAGAEIVGYAEAITPGVVRRAERLGARIVATGR